MKIYLMMESEPAGGYFSAQETKPNPVLQRYVEEIRVTDIPADLWRDMLAGILPVDEDHSNDSTWIEYWDDATPVWKRT